MKKQAVNLTLAILLSASLSGALLTTLDFPCSFLWIGLLSLFFSLLLLVITWSRKTIIAFGLMILIPSAGLAVYYLFKGSFPPLGAFLKDFFTWISDYILGYEKQRADYVSLLSLLIVFLVSLVTFMLSVKVFSFHLLLTGGLLIFTGQIMLGYRIGINYFYLFLFLMLSYYMAYVYMGKSGKIEHDYAAPPTFHALSLPLVLLIFLTALAIPKSPNPLEIAWLNRPIDFFNELYDEYLRFTSYDYYSFSKTGFSKDDSRLGGRVDVDNTAVLNVKATGRDYLLGSVKDVYTGVKWTNSMAGFYGYDMDESFLFTYPGEELSREYHFDIMEPFLGIALFKDYLMEILDSQQITANILGDRPSTSGSNLRTNRPYTGDFPDPGDENILLSSVADDLANLRSMEIQYLNLRTKTLFKPPRPILLTPVSQPMASLYVDAQGMLSSRSRLKKGFTYTTEGYGFDYTNSIFTTLLKESYRGLYSHILNYENHRLDNIVRGPVYDFLQGRQIHLAVDDIFALMSLSEMIYEKYTPLPPTVTDRVRDLAVKITKDYDNDYDRAKALEGFLSSNYPYTLNPPSTPNDTDFVDFFLFEAREGYCIYYASAMAVMARSLGMAARLAEGYMLPPAAPSKGGFHQSMPQAYEVTNKNAHAWVEIYFEGFGWIPFEPTGPFLSSFYRFNTPSGQISQEFYEDPFYREYMEMMEDYESDLYGNDYAAYPPSDMDSPMPDLALVFRWIIYLVPSALVLLMVFNRLKNTLYLKRIGLLSPREAIVAMTLYYLKVMAFQDHPIRDWETMEEYLDRLEIELAYEKYGYKNESFEDFNIRTKMDAQSISPSGLRGVLSHYTPARYGPHPPDDLAKNHVLGYYNRIITEARGSLGVPRYVLERYIKGSF